MTAKEDLLAAVTQLTVVVERLEKTLREEYPKRAELDRKFITKEETTRKRRQAILIVLVCTLISLFISFFATIGTVSSCFLSTDARLGDGPSACYLLPGYEEAQQESGQRLEQFNDLLKQPAVNDKRLDRIEKKLGMK